MIDHSAEVLVLTYTRLDGRVLDLSDMDEDVGAHFERCYAAYRQGMDWAGYDNELLMGPSNPLLRKTGGLVTRGVWDTPAFQAMQDLGDRLGVLQGCLAPEGDPWRDPLSDEWIPSAEAARRRGVTLQGLHGAIRRGDVIAHPAKLGGSRLLVSARSLECWTPNRIRQAARRPQARAAL